MLVVPGAFVYIHIPKTGGTFVRAVLDDLFGPPIRVASEASKAEVLIRRFGRRRKPLAVGTHETMRARPEFSRALPSVACLRSPFDRYVSQFEFRWWTHDASAFPGLERLRGYPDVGFSDFLRYLNEDLRPARLPWSVGAGLGFQGAQLVHYLAEDEPSPLSSLPHAVNREDLTLLRTRDLNRDLYDFLEECGVGGMEARRVLERDPVLPPEGGRRGHADWRPHYSDADLEYIASQEGSLLDAFPEFMP